MEGKKTDRKKTARKCRVAVLISGRGSNLEALIGAAQDPQCSFSIVLVIAESNAQGRCIAERAGIPTEVVAYDKRRTEKPEREIDRLLRGQGVEIVCLAGFKRLLSPWFVGRWRRRVLNIHPSLLPKLRGLETHRRAIEEGHRQHGCSVHIVTEELDAGEVLGQEKLDVREDDSPETLAKRVLALEHRLYPRVLEDYARSLVCAEAACREEATQDGEA